MRLAHWAVNAPFRPLLLAVLTSSFILPAQAADLVTIARDALQNDATLAAARAQLLAAEAGTDVERGALLPQVNTDASVARLKGEGRPIHSLADRMSVLAALEMVDGVVSFDTDTPLDLVEQVTPDVLIKGEDWGDKGVVGREWVESHGGKVILAPLLEGRSTSAVIESLLRGAAQPVESSGSEVGGAD